jgi:hypothetical protein
MGEEAHAGVDCLPVLLGNLLLIGERRCNVMQEVAKCIFFGQFAVCRFLHSGEAGGEILLR